MISSEGNTQSYKMVSCKDATFVCSPLKDENEHFSVIEPRVLYFYSYIRVSQLVKCYFIVLRG